MVGGSYLLTFGSDKCLLDSAAAGFLAPPSRDDSQSPRSYAAYPRGKVWSD